MSCCVCLQPVLRANPEGFKDVAAQGGGTARFGVLSCGVSNGGVRCNARNRGTTRYDDIIKIYMFIYVSCVAAHLLPVTSAQELDQHFEKFGREQTSIPPKTLLLLEVT